jgi:glutamate 5-kinase
VDQHGGEFARGLTNYDTAGAKAIAGKRTDEITRELGSIPYDEVIHRDNLVVISLVK